MERPDIVIDEKPDTAVRDAIAAPLKAYNTAQVGELKHESLAIVLRAPGGGDIIGGLWGASVADWLYVDMLVVPEDLRKRGIGTSLMEKAEGIARKRGCMGVWVRTGTFQAPGFYEKIGYQRFGNLDDFPKGYETIWYAKHLAAGC